MNTKSKANLMKQTARALFRRKKYLILALIAFFCVVFILIFYPSGGNLKQVATKKDTNQTPVPSRAAQENINAVNVDSSLLITDGGAVLGSTTEDPRHVPTTNNNSGNNPKKTPTPIITNPVTTTPTVSPTVTAKPTKTPKPTDTPIITPTVTTTPTPTPTPLITMPVPSTTVTPGQDPFRILNLKPNLKAVQLGKELDLTTDGTVDAQLQAELKIKDSDTKMLDFDLNLTEHKNWAGLNAGMNDQKIFAEYPGGFKNLPGVSSAAYTMYVPKSREGIRVGICPNAKSLAEVNYNCPGLYFITPGIAKGNTRLSSLNERSAAYWKIDGLTEFGGALESRGYVIKKSTQLKFSLAGSLGATDLSEDDVLGVQSVEVLNTSNEKVAEFAVDFSADQDWSLLTGNSEANKAFLHYPGGFGSVPGGTGGSFALFIKKGEGDKAYICPGASDISAVVVGCADGYFVDATMPGVSLVDISGEKFWRVSGLTGTGGMSVVTAIKDTMDRLKIGVYSEHDIQFTTNNGLLAATDNMLITFATGFNMTGLTRSDIQLFDNGSPLTLAASPAASVWGVTVNTTNNTVMFLAPTATGGYIAAGHQVRILIGETGVATNQILNPLTGNLYEIELLIFNENGESTETGSIQVPIVDSDQVDVTGFVNNFMSFDIDTGTSFAADCDLDECLNFAGGTAAANYTVDLGELVSTGINRSLTSALHQGGQNGTINAIYLDLSSNAISGTIIMMRSANGAMISGTHSIPAVASEGVNITVNSGRYGFNMPTAPQVTNGTINLNSNCAAANTYCAPTTTYKQVFNTNNQPLQSAKIQVDIAVAAAYTNAPGNYSDTLTFIAIPTF